MDDDYITRLRCPYCCGKLCGAHGSDGVSDNFTWVEGEKYPKPADYLFDVDTSKYQLPSAFKIKDAGCSDCGKYLGDLIGISQDGIWKKTYIKGKVCEATKEENGWRICQNCFEAWQFSCNALYAYCVGCKKLTLLTSEIEYHNNANNLYRKVTDD